MMPERIQEIPVETVTGLAALSLGPLRLCEWALLIVSVVVLARLPMVGVAASGEASAMGVGRWCVAILLVALLAVHAAVEGSRWQMLPLYGAALLALLVLFIPSSEAWPRLLRWPVAGIGLGAVGMSVVAAVLVPLFRLPPPTGPLGVGTRLYEVVDESRAEPHARNGEPRRLIMQLWYPAEARGGTGAAASRSDALWSYGQLVLSRFWPLSHQRLVPTESRAEAPPLPTDKPRGVVIFAHAWGGTRVQNTALLQDLASRGYLVAAFDRPYNASYVVFPDGDVVTIPADMVLDTSSDAGREATLRRGAREASIGAADAGAVLNALTWLNSKESNSPFVGQIASQHAAIIGHSFGGAVAAEACRSDKRFVAALNLDGWIFGAARQFGVPCPYMLINDGEPVPPVAVMSVADPAMRNNARMQIEDQQAELHSLMQHGGWDLTIAGSTHEDFTDRPFYARLHQLTDAGSLPRGRVDDITRRYAAALVGLALDGRDSPWLQAAAPGYPEVSFRSWPQQGLQPVPGQEAGGG